MGKILQKKKARSGLSKARPKNNLRKSGNRKVNMLGNAIIAENWYAQSPPTQTAKESLKNWKWNKTNLIVGTRN